MVGMVRVCCFLLKAYRAEMITCVFMQWKFAFLSLGRPEYLQDGDIVASRFQVGGV
jgi:hypothetical protein